MIFAILQSGIRGNLPFGSDTPYQKLNPNPIPGHDLLFPPYHGKTPLGICLYLLWPGKWWDTGHVDDFVLEQDHHQTLVGPERDSQTEEDYWRKEEGAWYKIDTEGSSLEMIMMTVVEIVTDIVSWSLQCRKELWIDLVLVIVTTRIIIITPVSQLQRSLPAVASCRDWSHI
jgi:hypothetical protein